jgi:PAS domain-containing protein
LTPTLCLPLLRAETKKAREQGYTALRVTGEMTWALRGLPGFERLIEYEIKLNEFFPGSRCLALCQYDRRRFEPEVLLDVLRTHPISVIDAQIYKNFYYIPPNEMLRRDELPAVELRRWIRNLAEHKRIDEMLRETNEYLRNLLNYANGPIIVWNPDFRITRFNQAFESLTGYKEEEVIGQSLNILSLTGQTSGLPIIELFILAFSKLRLYRGLSGIFHPFQKALFG